MYRFLGCLSASAILWSIGKAMGIPVWRSWDAGDRCDLAALAFAACWLLTEKRS